MLSLWTVLFARVWRMCGMGAITPHTETMSPKHPRRVETVYCVLCTHDVVCFYLKMPQNRSPHACCVCVFVRLFGAQNKNKLLHAVPWSFSLASPLHTITILYMVIWFVALCLCRCSASNHTHTRDTHTVQDADKIWWHKHTFPETNKKKLYWI